MKLEIGKLYKRIDGGWLYFSDNEKTTYDVNNHDKIFLLVEEQEVVKNNEKMKKITFIYDNRFCYAHFPAHVYEEIENGLIFKEVKTI